MDVKLQAAASVILPSSSAATMDSPSTTPPPPPRRLPGGASRSTVAPPLPHRRVGGTSPPPAAAAAAHSLSSCGSTTAQATPPVSIDAIRSRGCANDYVDSNGLPLAPCLPPKPAALAQGFKKTAVGTSTNDSVGGCAATTSSSSLAAATTPLLADACPSSVADEARRHNLLNECRETDRLQQRLTAVARRPFACNGGADDSSTAAALLLLSRSRSLASADVTAGKDMIFGRCRRAVQQRGDADSSVELCPLAPGGGDRASPSAAAAVVIVSQPLSSATTLPNRKILSAGTAAASSHSRGVEVGVKVAPSASLAAPDRRVGGPVVVVSGGGSTTSTIVCPRCHECRCRACTEVRRLPETTVSCCGGAGQCRCSGDACVETASCMCCVRGLFYHCVDGGGGEDFSAAAEDPCACCERPLCCARWTALSMLAATCLPCLCCYWPMRGCLAAATACYNCGRRKGCRCGGSGPGAPSAVAASAAAVEAGSVLPQRASGGHAWRRTWRSGVGGGGTGV